MLMLPKAIYRLKEIWVKTPGAFCRHWKADPEIHREMLDSYNDQTV